MKQFTQDSLVVLVGISCGLMCFTAVHTLWTAENPVEATQLRLEQRQDING